MLIKLQQMSDIEGVTDDSVTEAVTEMIMLVKL